MITSRRKPVLLAITSGDRDGIGLEVTRKALSILGPQSNARFMIACSNNPAASRELRKLRGFQQVHLSSKIASFEIASRVLEHLKSNEVLIWRDSGNEAAWVQAAARLALSRKIDGIVTGPVSKGRFKNVSAKFIGHTGMLSAMAKVSVQQGYVGSKLSVVLATDHLPLSKVEGALNERVIQRAVANAKSMRGLLATRKSRRPIAVLGLNPHAGESGIIGTFERRVRLPRGVKGPLPADTAFTPSAITKYSVVVALYHDQGLIPFKLLHGQDSGFQISLGLPFVRTSVDHGTARDIFGKGQANPGSMIDALRGAIKMVQVETVARKK